VPLTKQAQALLAEGNPQEAKKKLDAAEKLYSAIGNQMLALRNADPDFDRRFTRRGKLDFDVTDILRTGGEGYSLTEQVERPDLTSTAVTVPDELRLKE
jgi:hypothetical protein